MNKLSPGVVGGVPPRPLSLWEWDRGGWSPSTFPPTFLSSKKRQGRKCEPQSHCEDLRKFNLGGGEIFEFF